MYSAPSIGLTKRSPVSGGITAEGDEVGVGATVAVAILVGVRVKVMVGGGGGVREGV